MNNVSFIVFPGQGSQKPGMGNAFLEDSLITQYVDQASEITKKDIRYLVTNAEAEELNKTENSQIAIFVLTYGLFKKFEKEHSLDGIKALAGHSLGEYTALAAGGVLSFEDVCKLIAARSKLMQQVSGKMLAVLNLSKEEAAMAAVLASDIQSDQIAFVVNYNSSTQMVLSGEANAIDRAQKIVEKLGKRAILLPVSGPFHSPYMQDACDKLSEVIDNLNFNEAKIPIISNIYAKCDIDWIADGKDIVKIHMRAPVRWQESLEAMKKMEAEPKILEIGATSLLANMAKRDGYDIEYGV